MSSVNNTIYGSNSLPEDSGEDNTAIGAYSLNANTTGLYNVAVGAGSLQLNTPLGTSITGSLTVTQPITGSLFGTASFATTTSFAATSSFASDFTVANTLTATTLVVQTVSSSVIYSSGSNVFGNQLINTQVFTGSLQVTGSTHYIYGNTSFYSGSISVGNITGSNIIGRIDASNDVVAFSTSDARLKNNVKPIENALDKLDKIGGYTFDWNNQVEIHGYEGHDIGVIAQEIESILPETVTTRDNGYKAVKYEKLTAFLIQVNKEQQQIIKDQQRQIDELRELINIYIKIK
jgi:hypothetical protein